MDSPPQNAAFHRARALREEGKSLRAIADILAAEAVPLPPGRATKWSHTAVVRLFRQFDTPGGAAEERSTGLPGPVRTKTKEARPRQESASPPAPAPPPPAHIDRDMPPLVGPGWVPEGWRPRLLLGLLVVALLATSAAALYQTVGPPAHELRTYRGMWNAMTEAERTAVNKRIRGD